MPYADTSRNPPQTDDALLVAARAGDEGAFTALYRRHGAVIYRFAWHWSGSATIADEVAQETFIHLHTRGGDFDPARGALRSWLLGVARNLVRRQLAERRSETPTDFEADAGLLPDGGVAPGTDEPLARLLGSEQHVELHRLIRRLPAHFRDALVLVDLEEHPYATAAAICGCEVGTIRSRLARARALLAGELKVRGNT